MVDDHGVELVCVASLNSFVLKSGQQWIHDLRKEWILFLVPVYLFVRQLTIQVVLVKRKSERKRHIVRQLALKLVKPFHLNYQNSGHYYSSSHYRKQY